MAYTNRDDAVTLAKEIEHRSRFTCAIVNIGKPRHARFVITVTDAWSQNEVGVGNWVTREFSVGGLDEWQFACHEYGY